MNRKKRLRLLPAVILALLLVADGVFYTMTSPSRLFSSPPSFGSGENLPGVDAPSDSSSAEGTEAGAERPDFDAAEGSTFPAFGGTEDGTPPDFTQNGDSGFPGAPPSTNKGAFRLMRWRFLCLPVGAVLVIAEAVYLLLLGRKKKSAENGSDPAEEDPAEQRMRSERRTRRIGIGVLCGLLVLSLVLQLVRTSVDSDSSSVTVNEEVKTAVAQQGTLETTLQSSGVVASAQEEELSVPGDITVTEYLVTDGDSVEAGDDIAVLERSSVLSAIADVQKLLEELDKAINEVLDSSTSSTITAPTGATLVRVYAKSGENVTDVMYDHGALALLSLDDLLAIKIANPGGCTIGDELKVTRSSGSSSTGMVSKVEKDKLTVTVDLDDFSYDEKVTVYSQDGKKLGKGRLFVYSPLRITGYSGTVKSVYRSAGASVSKGSKLFTLSDGERTAEYQALLRKRSKLVDQYNRLTTISKTGRLTAEQAGLISGLDQSLLNSTQTEQAGNPSEKAEKEDSSGSKEQSSTEKAIQSSPAAGTTQFMSLRSDGTAQTMALRSSSGNVRLRAEAPRGEAVFLSAVLDQEEVPQEPLEEQTENGESGTDSEQEQGGDDDSAQSGGSDSGQSGGDGSENDSEGGSREETPSDESGDKPGGSEEKPAAEAVSRTVSVHWQDSKGAALSEGLPGSLLVTLKADGKAVDTVQLTDANGWSKSWEGLSAGSSYTVSCDVPSGFTGSAELSGDSIVLTFTQSEQQGTTPEQGNGQQPGGKFPSGMPGKGKMGSMSASFGQGTSSGTGAAAQETVEEDSSYTMAETTLGKCISNDRVCVEVSVDELDVNSVTLGQDATVTLDALEGQSFTGTVTALSASGTNEGGNTKFTMTVTMDKDSSVLLGMSASVTLVNQHSKALLLPEAAIVEEQGKTWVYTSYNEKEDELSGLSEVTTGAADGESVEILSGLEQGTSCYYRYADSIRYSFLKR